jgi:hypothetical protein
LAANRENCFVELCCSTGVGGFFLFSTAIHNENPMNSALVASLVGHIDAHLSLAALLELPIDTYPPSA